MCPRRSSLLLLQALGLVCLLSACGQTDRSTLPAPVNPFTAARVGSDTTIEIMTWNIENFAKQGDVTLDYVREVVEGLAVDIVAVQEIASGTEFDDLVESLGGWDGVRARSNTYQNLGFLYRRGADLVVESSYEVLGGYSREFPRRPFVLECRVGGVPLVIINNHYKCCGNGLIEADDWDEEVRRRDANLLLHDFVATNYAGENVLVVGDLNDILTDAPAQNVFQIFLDDPDRWRFADMPIATDSGALWSYPNYGSHIDHILVTDPLFAALDDAATTVAVLPLHNYVTGGWSAYDLRISDHLPVVLRMRP